MGPNVNAYWRYVLSVYPDAQFGYFYMFGQLDFFPTHDAKASGMPPYSCIKDSGEFVIVH